MPPARTEPVARFRKFIQQPEGKAGCWLWAGFINRRGYGQFYIGGKKDRQSIEAHRWAYLHFVGAVPDGLQLDHLCRVRHCANPAHLEPVDCRTNLLRGNTVTAKWASRTHCQGGHPYDEVNTYITSEGARLCRICNAARQRERRRRIK